MKMTHVTGIVSGFAGGLLGAYVFAHVERGSATLMHEATAATVQQGVVTASRIRLVDAAGAPLQ